MTAGQHLCTRRAELDLSQKDVARIVGTHPTLIAELEQGRQRLKAIPLPVLVALAALFEPELLEARN